MAIRQIIKIDEDKCDGCGLCIVDCEEGALAIVDGKAKLVKDSFCDGLGACIGSCPTGALTIEEREADEFCLPPDHPAAQSAAAALAAAAGAKQAAPASTPSPASTPTPPASGCPSGGGGHGMPGFSGGCLGSASRQFRTAAAPAAAPVAAATATATHSPSALTHWPVQLHLVNFNAPQFQQREILIAADCSAFACGAFHPRLLQGKALAIACPKLDDITGYMEKLTALFQNAAPTKVTVVRMEVPCCRGISQWVVTAREQAGSTTPIEEIIMGVEGDLLSRNTY